MSGCTEGSIAPLHGACTPAHVCTHHHTSHTKLGTCSLSSTPACAGKSGTHLRGRSICAAHIPLQYLSGGLSGTCQGTAEARMLACQGTAEARMLACQGTAEARMLACQGMAQARVQAPTWLRDRHEPHAWRIWKGSGLIYLLEWIPFILHVYQMATLSLIVTSGRQRPASPAVSPSSQGTYPSVSTPKDVSLCDHTPKDVSPCDHTPKDVSLCDHTPKDVSPCEHTLTSQRGPAAAAPCALGTPS